MCTNVMYVGIVDMIFFYLFHELVNVLFFSHLLNMVYMGNWATLLVVLVVFYDTWNDSGS